MTTNSSFSSSNLLSIQPHGSGWRLDACIVLASPLVAVFDFFSRARNLEVLTPPWLRFEVLTPEPIAMQAGTLIDYRIRLHGIPIRWRTQITKFNPPSGFSDRQIRGPYAIWDHTHTFEALSPEVTRVRDEVLYCPRGGPLAGIVNALFVQREVERIFAFRSQKMSAQFGIAHDLCPPWSDYEQRHAQVRT